MSSGKYVQKDRPLEITTPLGTDVMLIETMEGREAINELFIFRLHLLAQVDEPVAFDKLLGQSVTVKITSDKKFRYMNGIVVRLSEGPQMNAGLVDQPLFYTYYAEVMPKVWLLTKTVQTRIFQQKSVVDILKEVLPDAKQEVQGTFEKRDYCVQYNESDFDFASRLMEEEGLYYYFEHKDGAHTMLIGNGSSYKPVPELADIVYRDPSAGKATELEHRVYAWSKTQEIRSTKFTLRDHCFEMADKNDDMEKLKLTTATVTVGKATHKLKVGVNDKSEMYEYPGFFAPRFDGIDPGGAEQASELQKIFKDGDRTVGLRMEAEAATAVVIQGASTCPLLTPGYKMTFKEHFDASGDYLLTSIDHHASIEGAYASQSSNPRLKYHNGFNCIPGAVQYRPPRRTLKPIVKGTQTARVVGPKGQEIFTDKYSRVKVQFHWDRVGKKDANSSCWVRVGTLWAGKQWGIVHIPRIDQQVIVDFIDGDPDQPIVVGSVYNNENMPPYLLPDFMTKSTLKTNSTLKGKNTDNYNELRFEDKKGKEQIYFHAEKDFVRIVEDTDALKVGYKDADPELKVDAASQFIQIKMHRTEQVDEGNETVTIMKGNRTITVSKGNDMHEVTKGKRDVAVEGDNTILVKSGNRAVTVSKGNDTHVISMGNREVKIDTGNDTLTIAKGNQTVKISLGKHSTEAMQEILLKVGGNSVKIDQSCIAIKGIMVTVEGSAMVDIKAPMTSVKGMGMLILKGGVVMVN